MGKSTNNPMAMGPVDEEQETGNFRGKSGEERLLKRHCRDLRSRNPPKNHC